MKKKKEPVTSQQPAFVLADIMPQGFKVKLKGIEYVARVYNTNDQCYFEEKYGAGFFHGMLAVKPSVILTEIAYHLISCDEDGNKIPFVVENYPSLEAFRRMTPQELGKTDLITLTMKAYGKALQATNKQKEVAAQKGGGF